MAIFAIFCMNLKEISHVAKKNGGGGRPALPPPPPPSGFVVEKPVKKLLALDQYAPIIPPIARTLDNSNYFLGPLEVRVIGSILFFYGS